MLVEKELLMCVYYKVPRGWAWKHLNMYDSARLIKYAFTWFDTFWQVEYWSKLTPLSIITHVKVLCTKDFKYNTVGTVNSCIKKVLGLYHKVSHLYWKVLHLYLKVLQLYLMFLVWVKFVCCHRALRWQYSVHCFWDYFYFLLSSGSHNFLPEGVVLGSQVIKQIRFGV